MEEFSKKKGKAGTRGQQQIARENVETITSYRNMILGSNGIFFLMMTTLGANYFKTEIVMFFVAFIVYVGCFQFLFKLGNPKYTEPEGKGQLLDPGLDLNMESGMAEHVKDLIILTSAAQLSSLISNYFWCLLLLAPARGFWMLWKNIVSPWLFAPAPEPDEMDEKKKAKIDRKMRRAAR